MLRVLLDVCTILFVVVFFNSLIGANSAVF